MIDFNASRPISPIEARRLLHQGRRALKAVDLAGGIALLRTATALDPRVLCAPWGLLPLLAAEGRNKVRPRMLARLQSWYHPPHSRAHALMAGLSRKTTMRPFIDELGLPLPRLLGRADQISGLDWDNLPDRVVIKPTNEASCDGVIVAAGGIDHMTGVHFGADLQTYTTALYAEKFDTPPAVMAEEMLMDVEAGTDPALVIPRDFKVFAVAGHAAYVWVSDRNAPDGRRANTTFARDGTRLPPCLKTGWPEAPDGARAPPGFDRLIAMAEYLSQKLPWLLRLDFYLTPQGPVFGEFTTYPGAGLNLTPFARRTLLQMWEIWPD